MADQAHLPKPQQGRQAPPLHDQPEEGGYHACDEKKTNWTTVVELTLYAMMAAASS